MEHSQLRSNYIFDPEDPAEQQRIIVQDELITKCMGGVLPPDRLLNGDERILDLACGTGNWAMRVAEMYPTIEIIGLDISHNMINFARAQARLKGVKNVLFQLRDVRDLDTFDEESFDFINARLLSVALRRQDWSSLWRQCYDHLRPGGWLRWSEADIPSSSSAAYDELLALMCKALFQMRHSFSSTGYTQGLCPHMVPLLKEAGFAHFDTRAYPLDASSYTEPEVWQAGIQDIMATIHLLKPLLLRAGVIDEQRYNELLRQIEEDVLKPDFYTLSLMFSVWAQKS